MRLLVSASVALLALGCGGEPYQLAPVSGRVTLDDVPLANVHVNFQPMAADTNNPGPGSYGKTDADGRYELRVVLTGKKGAVVGKHQVRISARGGEQSQQSDAGIV